VLKGSAGRLLCLLTIVLSGCGGSKHQVILEGPGSGSPTPPAGAPQITSLNPNTIAAGSAAFTLIATGSNFHSTTAIIFDGTTLPTTVVSSSKLQAQVPASLVAAPGSIDVIPSPQTAMNFGSTFTITNHPLSGNNSFTVSSFPVQANDMVWDAASQRLYLSIASTDPTHPNTIASLDPATQQLDTIAAVGTGADHLSVSTDGSFLYAALSANNSIQRFTLPGLQPDIDIPLGTGTYGPYSAIDIEAAPNLPHTIAVVLGEQEVSPTEQGGIVLFDDGVVRPNSVPGTQSGFEIDHVIWNSDDTALYGIPTLSTSSLNDLYELAVSSAGLQLAHHFQTDVSAAGNYGISLNYDSATGYLYFEGGQVVDPANGSVVATFPFGSLQGGLTIRVMAVDTTLNIAYFLGQTLESEGSQNYVLSAYDLSSYKLLGAVQISGVPEPPEKLVRWGSNGLAFLTGDGGPTLRTAVYLVSGDFVTSPAAQ
jgi:IPT/TIG domain